jgi:methylthioribose-1-phosphate isomerase
MADGLLAIRYKRGKLELLDQRLLPFETTYTPVTSPEAAYDAIKSMMVRGAPAIGCTAALATAAWLAQHGSGAQFTSAAEAAEVIQRELNYLVTRCLSSKDMSTGVDRNPGTVLGRP